MINKQSLWFLTLFSLILVLSVYYITMPSDLLLTNNSNYTNDKTEKVSSETDNVVIKESELLTSLRVSLEEERESKKQELEGKLTKNKLTTEEKNEIYEQLKYLNLLSGKEEELELKIKTEFDLDSFIKIDGNEIHVTIEKENHDTKLANSIMRSIQNNYKEKKYITVKFEK